MDKKLVIIPTYNEIENAEKIIRAVFALDGGYHILVIDDGSPDGTAAVVKELMKEFPERLFIIERSGKLGLGTAYITGFRWALEQGYDYVVAAVESEDRADNLFCVLDLVVGGDDNQFLVHSFANLRFFFNFEV